MAAPRRGAKRPRVRRDVASPRRQLRRGNRSASRPALRRQSGAKSRQAIRNRQLRDARRRAATGPGSRAAQRRAVQEQRRTAREQRRATQRNAARRSAALVNRRTAERRWVLRNRSLANRDARRGPGRALARATFGGRFWDRHRHHRHWHRHHHHPIVIGWIGPVFWPYAYYDFVDYTYWPYAYDAFWPYAYDEVYEGFFGPYSVGGAAYASLATGSTPRSGSGRRNQQDPRAPGATSAQICTGDTAGLTDWPIKQIEEAVEPDDKQRAALDKLGEAAQRAIELLRSSCPDALPSTPTGRLAAMKQRLETMREAIQIVRPALDAFYQSLSDEQKARFNALEPERKQALTTGRDELTRVCSGDAAKATQAPTKRIVQALRPNAEQRKALDVLNDATMKASKVLVANCPADATFTPPGRLAAMEQRLATMLEAIEIVQPALAQFYGSLTDEQKARFNELGVRRQAGR